MKQKSYERATARLSIRLRPTEKDIFLEKVKSADCSITALILQAINTKTLPVFKDRKEFITTLHLLSSEIHRIGININQAVHLMHQDKLTGLLHPTSVQQFTNFLKAYQQCLDEVKSSFQKIISYEQTGI